MSKRFTDTEKWSDPWFCALSMPEKLFWCYLTDNCNLAGIWRVNWPLVKFFIPDFEYRPDVFQERIEALPGDKWHLKKFVRFQYGELQPDKNRLHQRISFELQKEGVSIPLPRGVYTPQDKDKVKDKVKDKESLSLGRGAGEGFSIPEDLKASEAEIRDWLEYKRQRNESYKPKGLEALWRSLRAIPTDKRREVVDQSMASNWAGLFPKNGGQRGNHQSAGYAEAKPGKYAD